MAIQQRDYSMLSDEQLKQAMMFAQRSSNTPEFLGLMSEAQKRAKMRNAAQGMQAGQELAQAPQTEAEQVMAGIANLTAPSDEKGYASGGIVAFDNGGLTTAQKAPTALGGAYAVYKGVQYPVETLRQMAALEGKTLSQMLASDIGAGAKAVGRAVAPVTAPAAVPAAVAAGGAGLSALAANYLNRLPDEQLDTLTEAGGDTGLAAAILRNANRDMSNAPSPSAPARKEVDDRPRINSRTFQYPDAKKTPEAGPAAERREVVGTERVSGPGRSPSVPAQAAAAVQAGVMSRDEYRKAMDAYAEGDNKELQGIFAKSIERDAKRRAELEGENASTKGILGIDISGDTRKALQDAGIAMLRSKKPYLDIGEGIAAGLEGYDKRKEDRKGKLELLDKAQEARDLAILAAKQGNRKAAGEFMSKYDEYVNRIEDNRRADRQLEQTGQYQNRMAGVAEANARSAAAYRNAQLKRLTDIDNVEKADRKSYEALLRQATAAVDKELAGASQAEKNAAVLARLQASLQQNPWMSKYLFNKAPTGKTYSLMDEGD